MSRDISFQDISKSIEECVDDSDSMGRDEERISDIHDSAVTDDPTHGEKEMDMILLGGYKAEKPS